MKGLEVVRLSTHRGISPQSDIKRLLRPKEKVTAFDVGANRGGFSWSLLDYFPQGSFFAFESIETTFKILEARAATASQIRAVNCAVGERDGQAQMTAVPLSGSNRAVGAGQGGGVSQDAVAVKMKSLRSLAQEAGITTVDLLKTDCEGYDLCVLHGCGSLLRDRKVSLIYCEVNMRSGGVDGDFFSIDKYLRDCGYAFYGLYDYLGVSLPQAETFCNALWVDSRMPT